MINNTTQGTLLRSRATPMVGIIEPAKNEAVTFIPKMFNKRIKRASKKTRMSIIPIIKAPYYIVKQQQHKNKECFSF